MRRTTVDDAADVASWRYGGDWSGYDLSTPRALNDNLASYYVVAWGHELVGFCVAGLRPELQAWARTQQSVTSVWECHPKLVGYGNGARFGETVLEYLDVRHPGVRLRAVVQSLHERSLKLTHRLGFQDAGELVVVEAGRAGDPPGSPEASTARQALI